MSSPYFQSGASAGSGSPYFGGGSSAPAKPKSRGLFGGIGHFVAAKAGLAGHDLKAIPGGVVKQARDEYKSLTTPVSFGELLHEYRHPLSDQSPAAQDVKAQAKGALHAVEHPLADPLQTLLTFAPLAHGLGKAADVGIGLKTGTRLTETPRVLRQGEKETPLQPSTNPAVRLGQAGYDKVLQHALDTKPAGRVAAHAEKRIGGSLDETARYQQRLREAPAVALDRAAKKLTGEGAGKRVNQAALELTSVNTKPEDAAAYHLSQAAKGVDPARNRVVAKLYQTVHDKGLLTTNKAGDVIVSPEHPKLALADVKLAEVQGKGDAALARYGVRSAEQLQQAVDAPGRYRAGATYEKPTPGKLGVETPGLKGARSRVASLQGRLERASNGSLRTIPQARVRLAQLEKEHGKAVDKVAAGMFGPAYESEVRFRTGQNKKAALQEGGVTESGKASGASGYKASKRPTVVAERRALAEQAVEDAIRKNPDHPTLQRWRARTNKIDQLQAALNPEFGEKIARKGLGTTGEPTSPQRVENLRGALSVANEDLQRNERAAATRVKPTGVIGGETARPGRGHVSYAATEKRAPVTPAASSPGPVVGEARSPITSKANTGYNIEHGRIPEDITGQAARKYRSVLRFVNTTERRNAAIATGSDVRRSARDVLARVPGEEHAKITQAVEEALGRKRPTTDEIEGLSAALDMYRQSLVPGLADNFAADSVDAHPVGTSAKEAAEARGLEAPDGYKWVSRNALGELAKPGINGPRGRIATGADKVNSAVTSATVYFKFGHLGTRVFTNAATNIIQGSARPVQIAKSVELWKALTDEDRARALAASGQHSFAALPLSDESGRVSRYISAAGRAGASWWARHADAPFRFNSIAYEARKAGFDTPARFRDLLDRLERPHDFRMNAAETARVDYVAKRANREGIAYDRLSDFERRYITRAFWFYPWTAGATRFAVNTLLEHPYKSAALGTLGVQGRETQQTELGDLPSYEGGLFKVAGGGNNPLVADFSTFSPFATPADVLETPGVGSADQFLNPAYAALLQLGTRTNQYGQHSNAPVGDALSSLFSPTPEAQILNAYLHPAKPTQMFHKTPRGALARALVGPGLPRRVNLSAAHKAAARERSGR